MIKRRFLCTLTALCLLLTTLCAPVSAASGFFFVAVDDAIPLTLSALPHYAATGLYVPYTVFDAGPGGVVPAYNATDQTLVLFTRSQRLIFDLNSDTVTDESGKSSTALTTYRSGLLYVPLSLCASHFGLSYSMLSSADGYPVLRFTTGSEVYDDALFIEKAENLISYRVSQAETPDNGLQPQPGSADNPQPPEEKPAHEPVSVYLAVTDVSVMADAATVLEKNGLRAAFFLTAGEITENADLVRRLYAAGHALGVTAEADADDISAALTRANDALDRVLNRRALMALVPTNQADGLTGLRIFAAPDTQPTLEQLQGAQRAELVVCGADAVRMITSLNQAELPIQLLRETTVLDAPEPPDAQQTSE